MTTAIELYLRDQVLRGDVRNESGRRVVDLLNESTSGVIELQDAWSGSVHYQALPARRGTVRVLRSQVLFAIPHDLAPTGPRQLRAGYVEKRPVPAAVDLGPFFVSGTIHVGPYDSSSIELVANDAGKLPFIPFTAAHITSQYDPAWSLDVGIVLVNRPAITFVCTPSSSVAHKEAADSHRPVGLPGTVCAPDSLQPRPAAPAPVATWPAGLRR